jgi:hypothetical protein
MTEYKKSRAEHDRRTPDRMTSSTDRASAMARQATWYLVGRLVRNRGGALPPTTRGTEPPGLFAGVSSCPAPVAAQHNRSRGMVGRRLGLSGGKLSCWRAIAALNAGHA